MKRTASEPDTNASAFKRLVATLDYPLYIVTMAVHDKPTGCLIGFGTQCSIHPPHFLACISRRNHTFDQATHAPVVAVHVVDEENRHLAEIFGGESGDEVDKFAGINWQYVDGVPVLSDCKRWFVGAVLERIDVGDHLGLLIEPVDAEVGPADAQLTYQQAHDIKPGHKP